MACYVYVDDNFHYMDPSERYTLGPFESVDAALAVARKIVDDFLVDTWHPGMSAEQLFELFTSFGDSPLVISDGGETIKFSAWKYAKSRCEEICRSQKL